MKGFGPETFGDVNAADYDATLGSSMDAETLQSVETVVPDLSDFVDGQAVRGTRVAMDSAGFEVLMHDPVAQTVDCQRVTISEDGTRLYPHSFRYVWPSELDLMAQLAGLELRERWAWWDRSPFTATSTSHVSVYARAGQPGSEEI